MATPLGNLGDLSERAREVLSRASFIAGESSQAVMRWLEILKQHNPESWQRPGVLSYRESSREKDARRILGKLAEGQSVALISDAGTPGISDPGWYLVREARLQERPVWPVPGACAAVAALSVVPFPTRRFHFEGFLPHSGKQRRAALERVTGCYDTVVLYESPHRLTTTLQELAEACPERELFVTREMTKKFEEAWWGQAQTAPATWAEKTVKGEFTLVLGPQEEQTEDEVVSPQTVEFIRGLKLPAKTSAAIVRHFHPSISKKSLYGLFTND
ncbi:MAG: 16S rRNA (cytidine(1402)-2'-O)-methyltransferase [Candidatus Eremiobacteraeota bacterium]|nr:16S rRNA (cytidine(1402)-2'-O)-methyltransferase [Candidatus Eremiobacteraeota bacterium]